MLAWVGWRFSRPTISLSEGRRRRQPVRNMLIVGLVGFGLEGKVIESNVILLLKRLRLTALVRRSVGVVAWGGRPGPGAGVWFDIGPHLLDQAFVLFGTPRAIAADIRIERDESVVDDAFDVTLHYPNLRAVLRASMLAASPGPSLAVHGTRGSFIKYGVDAQEAALKAGRTPGEPDWDADPPPLYGKLTTPEGTRPVPTVPSSYARYYENVRDAILGTAQLAVTPEQALDVMRGLELAVASSQQRRVLPWTT